MLFDAYLIVDWSSNSSPKKGADSIWLGWTRRTDGSAEMRNPSTRADACRMVLDLLRRWAADGDRILVGFDFAYGYPQGLAEALGLAGPGPPWRRIWKELASRIQDSESNANNRFQVAADLNARMGKNVFWGCPPGRGGVYPLPGGGKPRPYIEVLIGALSFLLGPLPSKSVRSRHPECLAEGCHLGESRAQRLGLDRARPRSGWRPGS